MSVPARTANDGMTSPPQGGEATTPVLVGRLLGGEPEYDEHALYKSAGAAARHHGNRTMRRRQAPRPSDAALAPRQAKKAEALAKKGKPQKWMTKGIDMDFFMDDVEEASFDGDACNYSTYVHEIEPRLYWDWINELEWELFCFRWPVAELPSVIAPACEERDLSKSAAEASRHHRKRVCARRERQRTSCVASASRHGINCAVPTSRHGEVRKLTTRRSKPHRRGGGSKGTSLLSEELTLATRSQPRPSWSSSDDDFDERLDFQAGEWQEHASHLHPAEGMDLALALQRNSRRVPTKARQFQPCTAPQHCAICFDQEAPLLQNLGSCAHAACEECWRGWVDVQLPVALDARREVRCFAPGCRKAMCPLLFNFQPLEQKARLREHAKKLRIRRRLQTNELYPASMQVDCPQRHCVGIGYLGFDQVMCFVCEHQWDAPRRGRIVRTDDLGPSELKRCPRCKEMIDKDGGCDHMTCRCGHEFSWTTLKPYHA